MTRHTLWLAATVALGASAGAAAQDLTARATFKGHTFRVDRAVLSPDGALLASGGGDTRGGELKLWDAASGKELGALAGYTNSLYHLVFSPDGKLLASVGMGDVQVWDVGARKMIAAHKIAARGWQQALAFNADSTKLAWADHQTTFLWDAAKVQELACFKRHHSYYSRLALSPDLATLAVSNYQEIDLWDVGGNKERAILSEHRGEVGFLAFSSDGKTLVAASTRYENHSFHWKGDLKLWDVATGRERVAFARPFGAVRAAALSPDGKTLALLDSPKLHHDPDLKLIDVTGGRQQTIAAPAGHDFTSLGFTRDNRLFVIGTVDDMTLRLWQVSLGKDK